MRIKNEKAEAENIKSKCVIIQNKNVQSEEIKLTDVIIQNEKVETEDTNFKDVNKMRMHRLRKLSLNM